MNIYYVLVGRELKKILRRQKPLTASQQDSLLTKYWNRYCPNNHGHISIALNICNIYH